MHLQNVEIFKSKWIFSKIIEKIKFFRFFTDNFNMKKILFLILSIFVSSVIFAQEKFLGFDFALVTGLPFYGSSEIRNFNSNVSSNPNRIVIGSKADLTFKLIQQLKLVFGSSCLADFNWNGADYSNHFDYDFFFGVKIYPNLAGFNFGLGYLLGERIDFVNTSVDEKQNLFSAWGNGFKVFAEYDFHHNSEKKCLPVLGSFYKFVPRGSDCYDNYLGFYAGLSF